MGIVQAQAIMSLDGFVAKQDNSIGRLFDWLQNGPIEIPTRQGIPPFTLPNRVRSTGDGGCPHSACSSAVARCST